MERALGAPSHAKPFKFVAALARTLACTQQFGDNLQHRRGACGFLVRVRACGAIDRPDVRLESLTYNNPCDRRDML